MRSLEFGPEWHAELAWIDAIAGYGGPKISRFDAWRLRRAIEAGTFGLDTSPADRMEASRRHAAIVRTFRSPEERATGFGDLSLLPSLLQTELDMIAKARGVLVLLEVVRFRREHGVLPETLSEVMTSPPIDPYTQRPMVYRIDEGSEHGFTIYSAGWDGRDDGGPGAVGELDPTDPVALTFGSGVFREMWVEGKALDLVVVPAEHLDGR